MGGRRTLYEWEIREYLIAQEGSYLLQGIQDNKQVKLALNSKTKALINSYDVTLPWFDGCEVPEYRREDRHKGDGRYRHPRAGQEPCGVRGMKTPQCLLRLRYAGLPST